MGLDFDPIDYCRTLAKTPSPYKCPVEKCNKSYKSIYGLQYHLVNYDHDTCQQISHITPISMRKKNGNRHNTSSGSVKQTSPTGASVGLNSGGGGGGLANFGSPKEGLTYLEAQKVVQFEIDGKSIKVSTVDSIPTITADEYQKLVENGEAPQLTEPIAEAHIPLPEAKFKKIENYSICDAPTRPNAYIRFIEKSPEELDCEVEYDVDEDDTMWLQHMNESRSESSLNPVSVDTLELLMDRLEKESYFQAAANGQSGAVVDDDAVCCICLDGECQNTNVILFCDMCNLAVHQDCYGVPYIPEGQWLCRRCLQSPSRPVECVLCPNTGGAFKQTDRNQWAHVVCALWIPEVRFANTVFLEPIDSIETIPAARWRLTCYICKQKGVGACIQCQRNSCYAAFHVTCAQQAGLYMHMDTVKDSNNEANPITVQKIAYCDAHCPANISGDSLNMSSIEVERARQQARMKMKQARKMLAMKRESVPLILIPTIPSDRIQEITSLVHFPKKTQFIQRLIAYWTLKRQHRNGVPLLRRLQSQGQTHHRGIEGSPNASELNQQLKYWQCLRQDLERARLLCELVRKREKLKAAFIRTIEQTVLMQLNPLEAAMGRLLDQLFAKDANEIFTEPVDIEEVPDYMDVVTHPMDLGTMRKKLQAGKYQTLDDMENDFNLMIQNCLAYNNKDTIFYRAGVRMRDQCGPLFKSIRKELIRNGIVEEPQSDESIAHEVDDELIVLLKRNDLASDEMIEKLQALMEKALRIKHGMIRGKRIKAIRVELAKARKVSNKSSPMKAPTKIASESGSAHSDDETIETRKLRLTNAQQTTPPCSPIKSANSSASPSGVNRRTAVLFTRKAQAQKKTEPFSASTSEATIDHSLPTKLPCVAAQLSAATVQSIDVPPIKSPKKVSRARRINSQASDTTAANKAEPSTSSQFLSHRNSSPQKERYTSTAIPDSFRQYRGRDDGGSTDGEESITEFTHSSCSSCSGESGSYFG